MRILFYIVGLFIIFVGCEEIEDPSKNASYPEIKIDFEASGTKDKVDSLVKVVNEIIEIYNDTIDNGGDSVYFTNLIAAETIVKDSLNGLFSLLKSSRITLDSIYAIGGVKLEKYQDTTNSAFLLPLNILTDTTTYVFKYLNLSDTLTFSYQTKTVTGLDKIVIVAYNINVVTHTFDSLSRHYCLDENCTNGKILFKVYF